MFILFVNLMCCICIDKQNKADYNMEESINKNNCFFVNLVPVVVSVLLLSVKPKYTVRYYDYDNKWKCLKQHIRRECVAGEDYLKIWPGCNNNRMSQRKRQIMGRKGGVELAAQGLCILSRLYILAGCDPLRYIVSYTSWSNGPYSLNPEKTLWVLSAVATFWPMSLVGIYLGGASWKFLDRNTGWKFKTATLTSVQECCSWFPFFSWPLLVFLFVILHVETGVSLQHFAVPPLAFLPLLSFVAAQLQFVGIPARNKLTLKS